jgi:hypothetical protein
LWLKFCCGLASALSALAAGKKSAYHEALAPTVPLSRHVLRAPTRFYKQRRRLDRLVNCHHDDFVTVGALACACMKQLPGIRGCA